MHPKLYQVSKFPDVHWTSHFPFGIQTFLVLFHVGNDFFGTQKLLTSLLACLFTLMATTLSFFSSSKDKVWRPSCPPYWCRCWRACLSTFSLSSFLLPHFSPCTHRTCDHPCGTRSKPRFVLHQASSLPWRCYLDEVGLLRLAFHLSQVLGEASYFLLELLILLCNLLFACIYNNFLNTNLVAQGWV